MRKLLLVAFLVFSTIYQTPALAGCHRGFRGGCGGGGGVLVGHAGVGGCGGGGCAGGGPVGVGPAGCGGGGCGGGFVGVGRFGAVRPAFFGPFGRFPLLGFAAPIRRSLGLPGFTPVRQFLFGRGSFRRQNRRAFLFGRSF